MYSGVTERWSEKRIHGASQDRSTTARDRAERFFSKKILLASPVYKIVKQILIIIFKIVVRTSFAKNCTFRSSSAVERSPVKRLVVGSIPTHGA